MKKKLHETTVALDSLGCKLNQAEMEILARQFSEAGYWLVSPSDVADMYILNTCTVTHVADRKTRQKLRGYHRKNPKAAVVAVGCYSERAPGELQKLAGIDLIIGNDDKPNTLQILKDSGYLGNISNIYSSRLYENSRRTRAFINVQEGCQNFCAYCIVPYVRRREASVPADDIIKNIKHMRVKYLQQLVVIRFLSHTFPDLNSKGISSPNLIL